MESTTGQVDSRRFEHKVWAKVPGLQERYEVSPEGVVRTLPYVVEISQIRNGVMVKQHRKYSGRICPQRLSRGGKYYNHVIVSVQREGGYKTEMRVDNIVARTFLGLPYDPEDQRDVQRWKLIHKDGDIWNNRVDNLEWVEVGHSWAGDKSVEWIAENRRKWEETKGIVPQWMKDMYAEEWAEMEAQEKAAV
ncbi:HNH endonuclease [Mycobacterium phage Kumao]|uniref:HNH endonuclease n=1 Tax=Mycobacterium phage Kumao TaxID=2041344 RepID=A0A2D1GPW2_9CAUD|nr:HNH endonuclease [Mycobacterium phage Kumao]ATN94040.1 HNH endonuclease [Mycobacterium phage Kumao]